MSSELVRALEYMPAIWTGRHAWANDNFSITLRPVVRVKHAALAWPKEAHRRIVGGLVEAAQ